MDVGFGPSVSRADRQPVLVSMGDRPAASTSTDGRLPALHATDDRPAASVSRDGHPPVFLSTDDRQRASASTDDHRAASLATDDRPASSVSRDGHPSVFLSRDDRQRASLSTGDHRPAWRTMDDRCVAAWICPTTVDRYRAAAAGCSTADRLAALVSTGDPAGFPRGVDPPVDRRSASCSRMRQHSGRHAARACLDAASPCRIALVGPCDPHPAASRDFFFPGP